MSRHGVMGNGVMGNSVMGNSAMGNIVDIRPRKRLTPAQELIWTSQRRAPDSPLANMAITSKFQESLDGERFIEAFDRVVQCSDTLRTTFEAHQGVPRRRIHPTPPCRTELIELPSDQLAGWIDARIAEPLRIDRCVYDSVLVQLTDTTSSSVWFLNVHHIATDSASSATIFTSTAAAYFDSEFDIDSYDELAAALEVSTSAPRTERARRYWQETEIPNAPTTLYTRRVSEVSDPTRANRWSVAMNDVRVRGLDALLGGELRALTPGLSLTTTLATCLTAYLSKLGNKSLTLGVPVHHRTGPKAHAAIGPMVELFPCHIDVSPNLTLRELHKVVSRSLLTTLQNALPGTSPRQEFDVVLNVTTVRFGDFGAIPTTTRWIHCGHVDAHHRLRLQALNFDASGPVEIALDINDQFAEPNQHERASEHFGKVLDAMIDDLDTPLRRLDIVGDEERLDLGKGAITGPGRPLPQLAPGALLRDLLQPQRMPAVRHGSAQWTGQQLNDMIDRVTSALTTCGIGPGDRVAVELPIGIDALAAIHGIHRAGASFVPIDPTYPDDRRKHIAHDSSAKLILDDLPGFLNRAEGRDGDVDSSNPVPSKADIEPDDEAYVIYTSGTTGVPKGVPISHKGLAEYLGFAAETYLDAPPVMPLFTSLSFDLTITTLFLPLLTGGTITLHPDGGLPALREIVDEGRATVLKATPSHLELFVRMIEDDHPLHTLIVGGEAFLSNLADRLIEACADGLSIHNEYGPTETVVGCMHHRYDPHIDPGPEVPIGVPAPGVELRVMAGDAPAPAGVVGELLIARPGMTTGYIGLPTLNDDVFPHGLVGTSGQPMYRSGDLVRLRDDGKMIYLGRIDEQIKVGGIRIEPAEIERAALDVTGVSRAVAGVWRATDDHTSMSCVRCGLSSRVPGISIDVDGVCTTCHEFDVVAPQAASWFKTEDDLQKELRIAARDATGDYDVIHLLSGGKDSTYALFSLVEHGARVLALTLDNGFISDGAKDNVRRATAALEVDHRFLTVDGMNDIFRDSLDRHSNVCQGCYKTIYTVALKVAEQEGVKAIVTGLSRGQFFETRLIPGMFEAGRFDPDEIDRAVDRARRVYHSTPDAVSEHLDTRFLESGKVLDSIRFIDFYRYTDVPLSEMIATLEASDAWRRPVDTGRSTNCLINAAGIHVHTNERGYHSYAEPYAWDVRLGHKTRSEALFELDDPMGPDEVRAITEMLAEVGYSPKPVSALTLWIEVDPKLDASALDQLKENVEQALSASLPEHALPRSVEVLEAMPLSPNGKIDHSSLPIPVMRRTLQTTGGRPPKGVVEGAIAGIWERVLALDNISATDDFFAIGGDSLAALEMIVLIDERFDVAIPESVAFTHRTVATLAALVEDKQQTSTNTPERNDTTPAPRRSGSTALSQGEEALLFEYRTDPRSLKYNVARLYHVEGDVDLDRFDAAVKTVVAHQPTLHTSYGPDRRTLSVAEAIHFERGDNTDVPLDELAAMRNQQLLDLIEGPLVAVHHLPAPDGEAILLRAHHIVCDAGSMDTMWEQISLAYQGVPLPELTLSYADHQAHHRTLAVEQLDAWNQELDPSSLMIANALDGLDGYISRPSPITHSQLRACRGTTAFGSALGALATSLRSSFNGDQVDLTITASLRDRSELHSVVGYFLNPLPVIVNADLSAPIGDVADTASEVLARSMDRRSVLTADLIRSIEGAANRTPSSQIMLAFEDLAPATLGGQPASHKVLSAGTAVNDLTFFVKARGEELELGCEYRGSIGHTLAAELLDAFAHALKTLVHDPLALVEHATRRAMPLLGDPLAPRSTVSEAELPLAKIRRSIARFPDSVAVRSNDMQLTYAELDVRARQLAAELRRFGVQPHDRVGIVIPRSEAIPAAILACWYIGASYVPISIDEPRDRMIERFETAGVAALIADGIDLDLKIPAISPHLANAVEHPPPLDLPTGSDEAYLIFTSGSTGAAKGVPITHGALAHSLSARQQFYGDPVARFLLVSAMSFDSSVAGLFWTLADGGMLLIPTDEEIHNVDALVDLIANERATHTLMVPSLYQALLARATESGLGSLRTMIVAGETCPPEVVERHGTQLPGCAFFNEYGPTEATVWSTVEQLLPIPAALDSRAEQQRPKTVPIGSPIPGLRAMVVDESGRPLPRGCIGELWIGGATLSSGYVRSARHSAEPEGKDRFVSDIEGVRYYRTGDRVTEAPPGTLQFLGRVDDQLSVGGVRIEPAEIEACLLAMDDVTAAAVAVREARLVAWIVPSSAPSDEDDRIDRALNTCRSGLPATHLPKAIEVVDSLPRNRNGKLDRARLVDLPLSPAAPHTQSVQGSGLGSISSMAALWSVVFGGKGIAPDTDFFEAGGDSLRAVELMTRVEEQFGRRVGIGELIAAPTPTLLTTRLGLTDAATSITRGPTADAHPTTKAGATTTGLIEWLRPGEGDPLVILPPGGGNLLRYQPLVAALPSGLPVVGVRLPGADGQSDIETTIEAQAAVMLAELEAAEVTPKRWRLLGWSTGGLLAWEIGKRLHQRGAVVEQITLVDTYMPGYRSEPEETIAQKYVRLFKDSGRKGVLTEASTRASERINFAVARRRFRRARDAGRPPSILDAERELGPVIRRASEAYRPQRAPLPMLYLAASESNPSVTRDPWAAFVQSAKGSFELVTLEGVHFVPEERCILNTAHAPDAAVAIMRSGMRSSTNAAERQRKPTGGLGTDDESP